LDERIRYTRKPKYLSALTKARRVSLQEHGSRLAGQSKANVYQSSSLIVSQATWDATDAKIRDFYIDGLSFGEGEGLGGNTDLPIGCGFIGAVGRRVAFLLVFDIK
jgi:hypothetical protein